MSKLIKTGLIRKYAPRLYSSNKTEPFEEIIRRNIFQIIGNLYPETILIYCLAFEFKPTKTEQLFLITSYTKKVKLLGITLQFLEGAPPLDGDNKFAGELYVSQKASAYLKNLQVSKKIESK